MDREPPAIDLEVLEQLLRGSRELGRRMVRLFDQESEAAVANLERAVAAGDDASVKFHAHRLRGTARVVGAQALAEACARLEDAAASGSPGDREADLRAVRDAVPKAREALDSHVEGLTG